MSPDLEDGTSAAGTWIELRVDADPEAVEAVSEILSRVATGGVSVEQPFTTEQEGLAAVLIDGAPAIVRGYLPALDAVAADTAVAATRERLGHLSAFGLRPIGELVVAAVHEEDWATAWKEHFPVMRIGRRIVIRPTWREHDPAPDDVVVALDPGMAFGTGLHPSTRLCLAGLERWDDAGLVRGASVLDVGSGSGILLVAAGLLGATPLRAVDTDPIATEATMENARRNDLSARATTGTLPVEDGPFDLILANLVAGFLVDLAKELASALRSPGAVASGRGGRLLASGIFIDREPEVLAAFESVGLRLVARDRETDWVALDVERAAP
jgi:ribosomal protein L11 methyltransferase